MRRRVASATERLPLSAYDTVLRDTPERRAISPMFIGFLPGALARASACRPASKLAFSAASESNRFAGRYVM
jgi:hypothetical protein